MKRNRLLRSLLSAGVLLLLVVGVVGIQFVLFQRQQTLNRELIAAMRRNDADQALRLVDAGANPGTHADAPLSYALPEILDAWWHHAALPKGFESTGWELAFGASNMEWNFDKDAPELVEAMIRHGANPNFATSRGWTALMSAVHRDHPRTVEMLLKYGADVNAGDKGGWTALMYAYNSPGAMRVLLEHGADVSIRGDIPIVDEPGELTPLMITAMRGGSPEAIDLLIAHGVDVNARDTADETALYCATKTYFGHSSYHAPYPADSFDAVVRALLAHGANPNLPTKTGDTVIKLVRREYRPDLVALMLTYSKKRQRSNR